MDMNVKSIRGACSVWHYYPCISFRFYDYNDKPKKIGYYTGFRFILVKEKDI